MTSAKPSCPRNRPSRVRYPPSTAVRSSLWPSSANGPRFPASGPSTALPANSSGPPARPQPVQHHRPPDPQRQTAGSELAHRLGWYFGFHPLAAVTPTGVITGFGFGPASADDLPLAETLFALRAQPDPRLPSAGRPASGEYVADSGFSGRRWEARWIHDYGVQVVCSPQRTSHRRWPKAVRRWVAVRCQVIETVFDRLLETWGLWRERPHELSGLHARLQPRLPCTTSAVG